MIKSDGSVEIERMRRHAVETHRNVNTSIDANYCDLSLQL